MAKGFLYGYLLASFLNFATGGLGWRTVLDLLNGALLGYYMTTGFKSEAEFLARDGSAPVE